MRRLNRQINLRIPNPDDMYGSINIAKFINFVMKGGKKDIARKIVYTFLDRVSKDKDNIAENFENLVTKIQSSYELKKMKFGGSTYQIPQEVCERRQASTAMKSFLLSSRNISRKDAKNIIDSLEIEYRNVFNNTGETIRRKDQTRKIVDANRAFEHMFRKRRKK